MRTLIGAILITLLAMGLFAGVSLAQDVTEDEIEDAVSTAVAETPTDADESLQDDLGEDASELQPWEQWEYMVGFFIVPMITGLGIFKRMNEDAKVGVFILVSIATTAVGLYLQGDFQDVSDWPSTIISLMISGFVGYKTLFRAVRIPQWLESKTGGDPLTRGLIG